MSPVRRPRPQKRLRRFARDTALGMAGYLAAEAVLTPAATPRMWDTALSALAIGILVALIALAFSAARRRVRGDQPDPPPASRFRTVNIRITPPRRAAAPDGRRSTASRGQTRP
jgi:hypothetical protein